MARRSITAPASAVGQARGLLWLAEAARDAGVQVLDLTWSDYTGWHTVGVVDGAAVEALARRLGVPMVPDGVAWARAEWTGMNVEIVVGQ